MISFWMITFHPSNIGETREIKTKVGMMSHWRSFYWIGRSVPSCPFPSNAARGQRAPLHEKARCVRLVTTRAGLFQNPYLPFAFFHLHTSRQGPSGRFPNSVQLRCSELHHIAHEPPAYPEPLITDDMNSRQDDNEPRSSTTHGIFSTFLAVANNLHDIAIAVNLLSRYLEALPMLFCNTGK